jgi:hypothetical protein
MPILEAVAPEKFREAVDRLALGARIRALAAWKFDSATATAPGAAAGRSV